MLFLSSCTGDRIDNDLYFQAEEAFAQGKLGDAARYYRLFLESGSSPLKRIDAWERLLLIHLEIGRDPQAGMDILQSINVEYELDQDRMWSVFMRIGQLYIQQTSFENGIETLERALGYAPDDERLLRSCEALADAFYKRRDYYRSRDVLYQCLEKVPHPSPAHEGRINYYLGRAYYQLNNLDMAVYYLRETLYSEAEKNERAQAGILLYDVYLDENDTVRAMETITELKNFYPNPMVIKRRLEDVR